MSHPIRVRGLKQAGIRRGEKPLYVAPYTGAWIETCLNSVMSQNKHVAPYTGAWIETTRQVPERRAN